MKDTVLLRKNTTIPIRIPNLLENKHEPIALTVSVRAMFSYSERTKSSMSRGDSFSSF